jgi:hypothetical protein
MNLADQWKRVRSFDLGRIESLKASQYQMLDALCVVHPFSFIKTNMEVAYFSTNWALIDLSMLALTMPATILRQLERCLPLISTFNKRRSGVKKVGQLF